MKYLLLYTDIYLSSEHSEPWMSNNTSPYIIQGHSDCSAVTVTGTTNQCDIVVSLPSQTTMTKSIFQWFPSALFQYTTSTTDITCDTFITQNLSQSTFSTNWTDTTDYMQRTADTANNVQSILDDGVYKNTFTVTFTPNDVDSVEGITRTTMYIIYQFADSDTSINDIHALYPNNTEIIGSNWIANIEEWLIDGEATTYLEALPYQNVYAIRPHAHSWIYIGDDAVTRVYRGNTEITDIYVGNTKL